MKITYPYDDVSRRLLDSLNDRFWYRFSRRFWDMFWDRFWGRFGDRFNHKDEATK